MEGPPSRGNDATCAVSGDNLDKAISARSFDIVTLRNALQLWCSVRATAHDRYRELDDLGAKRVAKLFKEITFNCRVDRCDVRTSVTSTGRLPPMP